VTTVLAWMIITTTSGIEMDHRLMRSGDCRSTATRVVMARQAGGNVSINEYFGNLIVASYPIASIECRAFRMGAMG
jgi:hypothetical protein